MLGVIGAVLISLAITLLLYRRKGDILLFILRFLGLSLLLSMLFGVSVVHRARLPVKTAVLLDSSESMGKEGKFRWALAAVKELKELYDGRLEFLSFSGNVKPMADSTEPDGKVTDIAAALRETADRTVLLLSDGIHNSQEDLIGALEKRSKPVYVLLPETEKATPDFSISGIEGDETVNEGGKARVVVKLTSSPRSSYSGKLVVYEGEKVVAEKKISFNGRGNIPIEISPGGTGIHRYRVYLVPKAEEENTENNSRYFSITVTGGLRTMAVIASRPHPLLRHLRGYLSGIAGLKTLYLVESGKSTFLHLNGKPKKTDRALRPDADLYIFLDPDRVIARIFGGKLPPRSAVFLGRKSPEAFAFLNFPSPPRVRDGKFPIRGPEKRGIEEIPPLEEVVVAELPPLAKSRMVLTGVRGMGVYPLLFSIEDEKRHLAYVTSMGLWRTSLASPRFFASIMDTLLSIITRGEGQFYAAPAKGVYYEGEPVTIRAYAFDERGEPYFGVQAYMYMGDSLIPLKMEEPGKFVSAPFFPDTGLVEKRIVFKKGEKVLKEKKVTFKVERGDLEKFDLGVDTLTLSLIAERTGGKVLGSPEELMDFLEEETGKGEKIPLRDLPLPYFAVIALFLAEWLVRRLKGLL